LLELLGRLRQLEFTVDAIMVRAVMNFCRVCFMNSGFSLCYICLDWF
jgi:hypothetical protein